MRHTGSALLSHCLRASLGLGALALSLPATPAHAGKIAPVEAHSGLDIARAAAHAWATDAALVYLENDEDCDATGESARWGYLFMSPASGQSRAYSVRDGRILEADNLPMNFDAPPLADTWIDSRAAFAAAEARVGREFREKNAGHLSTMLLVRGAFDESDPDRTTWMLVYTAPNVPSLFVVVDAAEGKVRRTWRG